MFVIAVILALAVPNLTETGVVLKLLPFIVIELPILAEVNEVLVITGGGTTRYLKLLELEVPLVVVTVIFTVPLPLGTLTTIVDADDAIIVALIFPKLTLGEKARLFPFIVIELPILAELNERLLIVGRNVWANPGLREVIINSDINRRAMCLLRGLNFIDFTYCLVGLYPKGFSEILSKRVCLKSLILFIAKLCI